MTGAGQPAAGSAWRAHVRKSFGLSFWIFVLLAIVMACTCYWLAGAEAFDEAIDKDIELLTNLMPRVLAAQVAAGFVWVLVPRERMSAVLNRFSGNRGLIVATAAGIITPGGPASAFPFLAMLAGAGAERGILVAYITSWALLGMQRMIVWDIPFMGMEFSLLRFVVGLPLPIIAGLIARRLPYKLAIETGFGGQGPRPVNGFGAIFIYAIAAVLGGIALSRRDETFRLGIRRALAQALTLVPRLVFALIAAGFMVKMIPTDMIGRYLGAGSGVTGIVIGSLAGMLVPAGPVISFAIAAAFLAEGASVPALVSFVSGWSVFAAHRVVIFEIPLLGIRFVRLRMLSVALLPLLAGLLTLLAQRVIELVSWWPAGGNA